MTGLARQKALFMQLVEERILLFGFQETRLQKLHAAHDEDFILLKSSATKQEQYGIMMGFSRSQPYALKGTCPTMGRTRQVYFEEDHFMILGFGPRFLIARVIAPHLRFVAIAAQAPHSGHTAADIEDWWKGLHQAIPARFRSWRLVLLFDANASSSPQQTNNFCCSTGNFTGEFGCFAGILAGLRGLGTSLD
eukprot:s279_g29.t1